MLCPANMILAQKYPGDYCCDIYDGQYFEGDSRHLCYDPNVDGGEKWFNLASPEIDFNDKMSSYWCGAKIYAQFNYDYPGDYRAEDYGFTSAGNIWNEDIWLQGDISAVHLQKYDEMNHGAVTLFEEDDCQE